jgi:hypothetical protein
VAEKEMERGAGIFWNSIRCFSSFLPVFHEVKGNSDCTVTGTFFLVEYRDFFLDEYRDESGRNDGKQWKEFQKIPTTCSISFSSIRTLSDFFAIPS